MKNLLKIFTLLLITVLVVSCGKEENKDLESTSIAKIVAVTPKFSKLKEALEITGLTGTFDQAGSFTVFAPSNTAFDAVLGGLTIEQFDTANPGLLETVLKYHVLGANVMSTDLTNGQVAATLNGDDILITIEDNEYFPEYDPVLGAYEQKSVYVNGNRVLARDIKCSNGTIHEIESVLLP